MKNKTIGTLIVIFGALALFSSHDQAWIVSAIFLGVGSGLLFWRS
jgi:multisubunit Na+/H+ antiporter MnhG subunit|tara:strand:- start:776 stop:910 length:135 start_codon:yes stop_codon:yes gene_type:complete